MSKKQAETIVGTPADIQDGDLVTWPMTAHDGRQFEIEETEDTPLPFRTSFGSKYDTIFARLLKNGGGLKVATHKDAKTVATALKAWTKRRGHAGAAKVQQWSDGTSRVFFVPK